MKKFAVVLAGCGQHDGSETHETILTLLALAKENVAWDAFAPDIPQAKVVNHHDVSRKEIRDRQASCRGTEKKNTQQITPRPRRPSLG